MRGNRWANLLIAIFTFTQLSGPLIAQDRSTEASFPEEGPVGVSVDAAGYVIPTDPNFDPRTLKPGQLDRLKGELPENAEIPRGKSNFRPKNEGQLHYQQAQLQALQRGRGERPWVYQPMRAYGKTLNRTHNRELANNAKDAAAYMLNEAQHIIRTGGKFDKYKARELFYATAFGKTLAEKGRSIPGIHPAAKEVVELVYAGVNAELDFRGQDPMPTNPTSIDYIINGEDGGDLKLHAAKEAAIRDHSRAKSLVTAAPMTEEEYSTLMYEGGAAAFVDMDRYVKEHSLFQHTGPVTKENVFKYNPDYATSETVQNVERVLLELAGFTGDQFLLIGGDLTTIKGQNSALSKMMEDLNKKADTAGADLKGLRADLKDRWAKEDKAKEDALKAALSEAERLEKERRDQQLWDEAMGSFDSSANMIEAVSRFGGKKFQATAKKVSTAIRLGKSFAEFSKRAANAKQMTGFGKAALTMDFVTLGMNAMALVSGLNSGPSMEELILQEIQKMSKQLNERFDTLEEMLGDLAVGMNSRFDKLEEAIALVRVDVQEANARLSNLQAEMTKVSENLLDVMNEMRTLHKDQAILSYELFTKATIDFRINQPNEPINRSTYLANVNVFAGWASDAPRKSLFSPPVQIKASRKEAIALSLLPTQYLNLNQMMLVDFLHFDIKYPEALGNKTVPDLFFWRTAAEGLLKYIELHPEFSSSDISNEVKTAMGVGQEVRLALKHYRSADRVLRVLDKEKELAEKLVKDLEAEKSSFYANKLLINPNQDLNKYLTTGHAVAGGANYPYPSDWFVERPTVSFNGAAARTDEDIAGRVPAELRLLSRIRKLNGGSLEITARMGDVSWTNSPPFTGYRPSKAGTWHYSAGSYLNFAVKGKENTVQGPYVYNKALRFRSNGYFVDAAGGDDLKTIGYYEEPNADAEARSNFLSANLGAFFNKENAKWVAGKGGQKTALEWVIDEIKGHEAGHTAEMTYALTASTDRVKNPQVSAFPYLTLAKASQYADAVTEIAQVGEWRTHNLEMMAPQLRGAYEEKFTQSFNQIISEGVAKTAPYKDIRTQLTQAFDERKKWLSEEMAKTAKNGTYLDVVDETLAKLYAELKLRDRRELIREQTEETLDFLR